MRGIVFEDWERPHPASRLSGYIDAVEIMNMSVAWSKVPDAPDTRFDLLNPDGLMYRYGKARQAVFSGRLSELDDGDVLLASGFVDCR